MWREPNLRGDNGGLRHRLSGLAGMRATIYKAKDLDAPHTVKSEILITSVRVEYGPGHDIVIVWNRGGRAGSMVVNHDDGYRIAQRLVGPDHTVEEIEI